MLTDECMFGFFFNGQSCVVLVRFSSRSLYSHASRNRRDRSISARLCFRQERYGNITSRNQIDIIRHVWKSETKKNAISPWYFRK